MPLARYATAGGLLNKTARKLGLIATDLADPLASTDPEMVRLVALLNEVGQELAEDHEWNHLLVEHTINGDGVTEVFDLPADFLAMVEQSGWNRTTQYALAGPLSVQLWQFRKASPVQPVYAEFRLDTNQVRFLPVIPSGQVVKFEYRSRSWVRPAASGLGNGNTLGAAGADEVAVTGDFVLFDPLLVVRQLALLWKEDNGFDTTKAQEAAQRSLDRAKGRTAGAPVLRLGGGRGQRLIGLDNVPEGNW